MSSSIFSGRFQEVVRCCHPDAIFKPKVKICIKNLTSKVCVQILPQSVTSVCDFFFTFASLPGNGSRPERRKFIFSLAICKALWASKKMCRVTKCKSIIYHKDRFQNIIFPFGDFFHCLNHTLVLYKRNFGLYTIGKKKFLLAWIAGKEVCKWPQVIHFLQRKYPPDAQVSLFLADK